MSSATKSGIQTTSDGTSFIPSSTRADGSKRKEIRVRPGYRPPEDVETYKNRSAEAWKSRGSGGVPGVEDVETSKDASEPKTKNAKRREAAKRRQEVEKGTLNGSTVASTKEAEILSQPNHDQPELSGLTENGVSSHADIEAEAERQKKIRNQLKKLRAIRELKEKKANGEKLSPDQLMKVSKEEELIRDLKKLNYDGLELSAPTG